MNIRPLALTLGILGMLVFGAIALTTDFWYLGLILIASGLAIAYWLLKVQPRPVAKHDRKRFFITSDDQWSAEVKNARTVVIYKLGQLTPVTSATQKELEDALHELENPHQDVVPPEKVGERTEMVETALNMLKAYQRGEL